MQTTQLPCPAIQLILHRPPMLLIDELTFRQGDRGTATATVSSENVCFSDEHGLLPEYFIEIMAQTMAAANGYDSLVEGTLPKDGFIVGLDKFSIVEMPSHHQFTVKIVKTMQFGSMKVLRGEVFCGTTSIARGELKVWEQD